MPTDRLSGRKGLTGLSSSPTSSPKQQLSKSMSSPSPLTLTNKKPLTHKLVYSYSDEKKELDHRLDRSIDITANWSGTQFFDRKFQSIQRESFNDPRTVKGEFDLLDDKELAEFNKKKKKEEEVQYKEALKQLNSKIYQGFGSIDNMNRALKKRNGEGMLLYEFKEFLSLKNCDIKDDQLNLVFKVLDTNGEGILKTDSIIRSLALQENEDNFKTQEHDEMKAFLQEQLAQRRNSKTDNNFNSQRSNRSKDSDHLKEVQKALKQNTFGLDVSADDFNQLIEESFTKKHTQQSHSRFARFLRLTNVRLDRIPFYDMRNDELDRLKERASNLQTTSSDVNSRLKELADIRKEKEAIIVKPRTYNIPSVNPLQEIASPVHKHSNHINDDNSTIESDFDDNSQLLSMLSPTSQLRSPINANAKDFFPKVLDPLTRPKMKDAGSVLIMSKNDQLSVGSLSPSPPKTIGKRIIPRDLADYSRYGLSMDDDASVGSQSSQDRYTSTYKSYYPPVYYESSQPPVRDLESDADKSIKGKSKIRQERYNRKQANMDITFSRLEYENLKKESQQICRNQNRNEDQIRYQTSIFLNDMKLYRKQPLETMAKKPNLHLSDTMWGGHQKDYDHDSRNFQSTYNAGFNSSTLTGSPQTSQINHQTLKILRQQQNIFGDR